MSTVLSSVSGAVGGAVDRSGDGIFEGVQAVICDAPCSALWIAEFLSWEHDRPSRQDMSLFVESFCRDKCASA